MILIEKSSAEYRCDWRADGERCHYPGTISHSTLGTGPWYCHEHFRCNDGMTGAAIVARSEREYVHPEWTVAAVRAREYPLSDPTLPPMPAKQVRAILRDLREMIANTKEPGMRIVGCDPEREAERAAIQSELTQ